MGGEASRTPSTTLPLALILSSVPPVGVCCAVAVVPKASASSAAVARVFSCIFIFAVSWWFFWGDRYGRCLAAAAKRRAAGTTGRGCSVADVEGHALSQGQCRRVVDGVGGAAHVGLPAVRARFAPAA